MERTLKFKGKRIDNYEWVYGDLRRNEGAYYIFPDDDEKFYEIIPETLCECIGVSTVSGDDVYEGDTVKFKSSVKGSEWTYTVCYDKCAFKFVRDDGMRFTLEAGDEIETVTGNIYDERYKPEEDELDAGLLFLKERNEAIRKAKDELWELGPFYRSESAQYTIQLAFEKGSEWMRWRTIEKATEWIRNHIPDYYGYGKIFPEIIEDFRKDMEN